MADNLIMDSAGELDSSPQRRHRQKARKGLIQALYTLDIRHEWDSGLLLRTLHELDPALPGEIFAWTVELGGLVLAHREQVDLFLDAANPSWRLNRLGAVERSILRLGVTELWWSDTPPLVVIAEGVRLAELFTEKRAVAFIHALLDRARGETP